MVHREVRDEDGGDDQLDEAGHTAPGRRSEQRRKESGRKTPGSSQLFCFRVSPPQTAPSYCRHPSEPTTAGLENSLKRARISNFYLIFRRLKLPGC